LQAGAGTQEKPMQVNPFGQGEIIASPNASLSTSETASQGKNVFQQLLADVDSQQHHADTQVRRSLLGESEIHEAMLALEKANLSLRLLVQVRNKLVQAYEELSRMPM
jgi:flagellar hook-basal body complex protein FliE